MMYNYNHWKLQAKHTIEEQMRQAQHARLAKELPINNLPLYRAALNQLGILLTRAGEYLQRTHPTQPADKQTTLTALSAALAE